MLQPGERIDGRYVVERMLARGGMATVYVVRHEKLDSLHALKVLDIGTADIRRRLIQEGRVQASLRHPNIVAVTDTLEIEGQPALVMEYVDGPSLGGFLADHPVDLARAERWFTQIVSAVGYAHARGLVHRDLKPDNVLLAPMSGDSLPKVTDFGIAKVLEESGGIERATHKTRTGIAMGTPSYMPPEQVASAGGVDHRADVFALGCILYELVCGRRAFEGDSLLGVFNAIAEGEYTPPREIVPDLPDRFVEAIRGCLEPEPRHRIQDCDTLARVLRGGQPAPAPSKRRKKAGSRRGWWLIAGVGAGGLATAVVAGGLLAVVVAGAAGAWWWGRTAAPLDTGGADTEIAARPEPAAPVPRPELAAPVPRPELAAATPDPVPVAAPMIAPAPPPTPPGSATGVGARAHVLGYDVTVHGARRETHVRQGVMKHAANAGEMLLLVDVTVTNTTSEEADPFFPLDVLAADGTEYDTVLGCEMALAAALDVNAFDPGETRRGEACFVVPDTATGLRLRFKPEMTSDRAVVVGLP